MPLTYFNFLGYFIKYLDQTNYSELNMHSAKTPLTIKSQATLSSAE